MKSTRRRTVLAFAGTAIGTFVGGCASIRDQSDVSPPAMGLNPDDPEQRAVIGEKFHLGDRKIVVENPRVAKSVFVDRDSSLAVYREPETQYILADLTVDGERTVDGVAVGLTIDGATVTQEFNPQAVRGVGTVGLEVPVRPVSESHVVVSADDETRRLSLGSTTVEAIARRPAFAVRDARIVTVNDRAEFLLTVENVGERDGTFRGVLLDRTTADGTTPIEFPVSKGESITRVHPLGSERTADAVDLTTEWTADTRRFEYRRR